MSIRYRQLEFPFEILRTGSLEWRADRDLGVRLDSLYTEREQAVAFLTGGDTWLAWFLRFDMNLYLRRTKQWVLAGYSTTWTSHGPMLTLRAGNAEGKQVVAFISARTWKKVFRDLIYLVKTDNLRWQVDKWFYKKLDESQGR